MADTLYVDDVGSVLSQSMAADDVYVVNPSATGVIEVVAELYEAGDRATVNLLAGKGVLKSATADFVPASHAADLVADGTLSIRWSDDPGEPSLFVGGETVVSVVEIPTRVAGLVATDEAFVTEATEYIASRWADAEAFRLTAPALSDVRETLADELGSEAAADFDAALAELPAVRDGEGLDEVTVSLLVAARHGILLYDVSRWGEDVGLASKATFSRTKGDLEAAGLISTEKVPIEVGRPRLRLRLGNERLRGADVPELTRMARERLAGADESGT